METLQDQSSGEGGAPANRPRGGKLNRIAGHTQGLVEDLREWIDLRIDLAILEVEEKVDTLRNEVALGLTLAYILLRLAGRYLGGLLGVRLARQRQAELPSNIGLALTPQAGVAMGMALLAAQQFPAYGTLLLSAVVGSTVVFEILGPVLVKRVLR